MSVRKSLTKRWIAFVYSLRRLPLIHKPAKWIKDHAWTALVEASLEFCRRLLAKSSRLGPPTTVVSVYQNLRTGDPPTRGRIVLQDQGSPKVERGSLMSAGVLDHHKQQPWPVFWSHHFNAQLVTESLGLLLARKTLCLESAYRYPHLLGDPAYRFLKLPPPISLGGNWTCIVSRWCPCGKEGAPKVNHSHWLLDALPRLAVLGEFPPDTKIVVPANLHPQHKESLALLGVVDRCRFTSEHHLQVENYYFSAPTSVLDSYNPYAVEFLRQACLPKADQSYRAPKRFLIRRPKDIRTAANEAEVEKYFTEIGWPVIDVGTLSFAQQVRLFNQAEVIVGISGSAFTNAVFCNSKCRMIAFMFDWALDGWVEWISQVVGFEWHPTIVQTDYSRHYQIDLKAIKSLLPS